MSLHDAASRAKVLYAAAYGIRHDVTLTCGPSGWNASIGPINARGATPEDAVGGVLTQVTEAIHEMIKLHRHEAERLTEANQCPRG